MFDFTAVLAENMDRTYERNLPVSSLAVSRVSNTDGAFDGDMHRVYIFCTLCDSLLTTFPPEKKWIKRSTTFTSKISPFCLFVPLSRSYVHHFLGFAWCPLLCFFWTEQCLARLFGLSVLVYFQSHGFLCSGQLQIFPVYLFLWNLHHSCDYKLQRTFQCFFRHIYC